MDPQIRNFKDFLQLYNRITEKCFSNCVDNFYNRNLAPEEAICVDNCVQKFTNFSQRLMNCYVEVQGTINTRRMAELEAQAAAAANKTQTDEAAGASTNNTITESSIPQTNIQSAVEVDTAR